MVQKVTKDLSDKKKQRSHFSYFTVVMCGSTLKGQIVVSMACYRLGPCYRALGFFSLGHFFSRFTAQYSCGRMYRPCNCKLVDQMNRATDLRLIMSSSIIVRIRMLIFRW